MVNCLITSCLTFTVTANGTPVEGRIELESDANDTTPTYLKHKSITWFVIQRGSRYGLRVKDSESDVLKKFHGKQE